MKVRGDTNTGDLFKDYQPPPVAVTPRPEVKAVGMEARVAKAVAAVLDAFEGSREDAAAAMSSFLASPITKNALDAFCSEAREDHVIGLVRAWALTKATGDLSLLALIVEDLGYAIIPKRYLAAVEEAQLACAEEEIAVRKKRARQSWRYGR